MIEIKVPIVGESINEVTLVKWLKADGDYVERDEVIAELESEKATFELNAEQAGILKTVGKEGDTLHIGDTVAQIDETSVKPEGEGKASAVGSRQPTVNGGEETKAAPIENSQQPSGNKPPEISKTDALANAPKPGGLIVFFIKLFQLFIRQWIDLFYPNDSYVFSAFLLLLFC